MNKERIIQDVIPPAERSIRRIPLSDRQMRASRSKEENERISWVKPPKKRNKLAYYGGWAAAVVILVVIIRLVTFAEASVTIKPKEQTASVEEKLTASKDTEAKEAIPFEVLKITGKSEKKIKASSEETVEKKASGEIVIFNKHSSNPQVLIQNTRFETPEGLIFRTNQSVTVPGTQEKDGEIIPGQVRVKVFADKTGEKYNIGLTDFTVPGFKGLPQFKNFFARSASEMTGGFSGKMRTVDPETLEAARKELQQGLEVSLKEKALG